MEEFKFYWEKEKHREIKLEVPGFARNEIKAKLTADALTVTAASRQHDVEHGQHYYKEEHSSQSFTKSIAFPKKINPSNYEVKISDEFVVIKKKKSKKQKE